MRLAVMQPYVFPYIGYFQLMSAVNRFVFFDDVNFIKRGWIHRNAILANGTGLRFSIPLAGASQNKLIKEVSLHPVEYPLWRKKFMKTLTQQYAPAPYFSQVYALVDEVFRGSYTSIAALAIESLMATARYLQLDTSFVASSSFQKERLENTKGQHKILAICQLQKASVYTNLMGGQELYSPEVFAEKKYHLKIYSGR